MICVASDPPCHRHEQPSTDGLDELHSTPVSPLPTTTTDRTPVPCADNETWPCLHSSQWGDQDFPGHHPSQKQMDWIDKNSIYRLSDLPQRVRNQPWSMLNMTRQHTRSRTLPTRTAPVNHIPTGCPWQVFRAGRINYRDAGSYIQHWMDTHPRQVHSDAIGRHSHFTAKQLWGFVEHWSSRHNDGLARDIELDKQGNAGRRRRYALVLRIPARLIEGAGTTKWDFRPYWTARAMGLPTNKINILPLDESKPVQPKYDIYALSNLFTQAGLTDWDGLSQLCELGVFTHSTAPCDMILHPNYRTVAHHAVEAHDLKMQEQRHGIVSPAYIGPPLIPCRMQPYSAVVQPPKLTPRFCADLGSPRGDDDGAGLNSINTHIDFSNTENFRKLRLPDPLTIASDVSRLQAGLPASSHPIWIGAADWSKWYRQLPKPRSEWWFQIVGIDPGFRIDYAMIFGDAAAPDGANRAEDIFLELIYFNLTTMLKTIQESATAARSQRQYYQVVDDWVRTRCAAIRQSHPEQWQDPEFRRRQHRNIMLCGFFDDTIFAAPGQPTQFYRHVVYQDLYYEDGLFSMLVRALLQFADDLHIDIAAHKLTCGTPDGRTGILCYALWCEDRDKHVPPARRRVMWTLAPGNMKVLGKEIDLQQQRVYDTEQRVAQFELQILSLIDLSKKHTRNGRPTVPVISYQRMLGVAFYIAVTETSYRHLLNGPVRPLKLLNSLYPELERQYRTNPKRHGPAKIPWFSWLYFDTAAQQDLLLYAKMVKRRNGHIFSPLPNTPGIDDRQVIWIMNDASGKPTGGGGAIFWDPLNPLEMHASFIPWLTPACRESTLLGEGMSTVQEVATAVQHAELAVSHLTHGAVDILECLDNEAAVTVLTSSVTRMPELQHWVRQRMEFLQQHPSIRIFSVWNCREQGRIPDGISNGHTPYQPQGQFLNPDGVHSWTGISWALHELRQRGFSNVDWMPQASL